MSTSVAGATQATPVTSATRASRRRQRSTRLTVATVLLVLSAVLVLGAVLAIVVADVSRMSKSEVERIWLPFMPWLTIAAALLPDAWRRWGLALQVGWALVVQHLLYTSW